MSANPHPRLSPLLQQLLTTPLAGTGVTMPMPMPPPTISQHLPTAKRSKLWELADKHHCPVIGTCFTLDELRKLARRFQFAGDAQDDFALHVEAVGYARSRNEVSITMQRQLDRKFAAELSHFARFNSSAELLAAWQQALHSGTVAGVLWATYTHKAADAPLRQQLYGDIHMLSHQVGAGQAADVHRLQQLDLDNRALRQQQQALQQQHQASQQRWQQRTEQLEHELRQLRQEATLHEEERRRLARFESGEVVVDLGRQLLALRAANDQLLLTAQRVASLESALAEQTASIEQLQAALAASEHSRSGLEKLLEETATACTSDSDDCQGCSNALSPRCILYVGGRPAMLAQYRQLAERLGIRLLHHDGGQEEALSRLPELIGGADAVLCPTDSVSHSAYYQVKAHCKRVGKPCLFYAGGGISSFAQAVARINRGEFSLAAPTIP